MMHGYFVSSEAGELGFAVVAESEAEAIAIAWDAELRDTCDEWRRKDVGCHLMPQANIEGLPVGMVQDERDALCRGLYDFLQECECDECKQDGDLVCHEGRALCEDCIFDLTHGDDKE